MNDSTKTTPATSDDYTIFDNSIGIELSVNDIIDEINQHLDAQTSPMQKQLDTWAQMLVEIGEWNAKIGHMGYVDEVGEHDVGRPQ